MKKEKYSYKEIKSFVEQSEIRGLFIKLVVGKGKDKVIYEGVE